MFGDFESTDVPPFVLARIDLKNFLERLDGHLRPSVLPQFTKNGTAPVPFGIEGFVKQFLRVLFARST